ncbi:uncharacterized protein J4E84_000909 [Alternaria hordeiaustralica]|uniref:uncharacterized protein n=1 Tax=Alternaria hordeiaustralica TaxID=1187925 RepID=UPI0020C33D74|nr:uncharacterized protein J4E84_000909 [Alternaria hordeiaustralica]KAI4697776.1 hypothetical protein J4E84_000909 [Alternaria hordeiaustralica]
MSYTGSTFPASSATPPVSNTDAVPTSIGTTLSGPSSGNPATPSTPGYVPSGSSAPPSSNTDYVPTSPGAASTGSMSSGYVVPPASSAGFIARKSIPKWTNSVIELLGYPISPCWTVFQWIPRAISVPSGVSGGPSGSGYPYPSGGINGTIVAPYPSYIEVPINTGHVVGAGKSSLAAIVVALVFAHFA